MNAFTHGRSQGSILRLAALVLMALAATSGDSRADAPVPWPPQRIVSLNLCSDQMLLDLVPKTRIAALSELVADPALSARVEASRGVTRVRGHAEEVLALAPDLVLAGQYSTPATVSLLRRLGVNVVVVPLASDFDGIRTAIRIISEAVGEVDAGRAMIARFDARITTVAAGVEAAGKPHRSVVVYHINSLASGAGSLLDEIVRTAGYRNAARDMRLGPGGRLPLESLLLDAPDVLVMATTADDYQTIVADNLRHPAFQALAQSRQTLHLPMPLWMCGTADIAGAVEQLAAARLRPMRPGTTP